MEVANQEKFSHWKFAAFVAIAMLAGAILGSLPMLLIALGWFP